MKRHVALVALAAIVFSITVQPANSARRRPTSIASSLSDQSVKLGNVVQFKTAFQNDQGKARLVALVSPT
jgi:hypothetical protein